MEQSVWEANWFSDIQEFPNILCKPKVQYHIYKCLPLVPIPSALLITQEEINFYEGKC